jgi:hypothetical protein
MSKTPAEVIALTGGKTISDKIEFFKQQLASSGHASQSAAEAIADSLKAASIRNTIVHLYHEFGNTDGVTFIHRKSRTKVLVRSYTTTEFRSHAQYVSHLAASLSKEFGETEAEARVFVEAAKL